MAETPRLKLPLLDASQAQKHVTHNEALLQLDLLTGVIAVLDRDLSAPPAAVDGDVYILAGAGSSGWTGYGAGDLALRIDGAWRRVLPSIGMTAAIADEAGLLVFWNGSAWAGLLGGVQAGGPRFSAEVNYDFYVPADTWTKVAFNNAHHNDQGDFVAGSNHFLAPASGYYQFGANLTFKLNATPPTAMQAQLAVNGTRLSQSNVGADGPVSLITSVSPIGVLKLTIGDTVDVWTRLATNDGYIEATTNSFWGHLL